MPYKPVQVDALGIGHVRKLKDGGQIAPLAVRIVYHREGGAEVREARVTCELDAGGTVISLT